MKVLIGILAVVVIIIFFAPLRAGLVGARTDTYEQTVPTVATAGGVTTANVTLLKPLWEDDIVNVTTVTSSDEDDTPAVSTYASAGQILTLIGLAESTSRTITVAYRYGALTGTNAPADTFLGFLPLFIGIVLLVAIVFLLYQSWSKRGG